VITFTDITERKRIEEKLADRTMRLDMAQSAAKSGIWDWDVVTGHIEWSDQMASPRPYRPALGIDAALKEIEKNIGTFYDSTVADACLRLFREKGFRLQPLDR
jgi:PAS domain-containing protein